MEPPINQLLGLPIDRKSPFVVFTERRGNLKSAHFYAHYQVLWFLRQQ
ncbi:MAG: hypothetical protein QOJ44_873, partial [Acidimicrobiaceae bacterium]|nr:hypothetical protein [Acidimicrobiaceae bacterium]